MSGGRSRGSGQAPQVIASPLLAMQVIAGRWPLFLLSALPLLHFCLARNNDAKIAIPITVCHIYDDITMARAREKWEDPKSPTTSVVEHRTFQNRCEDPEGGDLMSQNYESTVFVVWCY